MSKPTTLVKVWEIIREKVLFTSQELMEALGLTRSHAHWYIKSLRRRGFIINTSETRGKCNQYQLIQGLDRAIPPILGSLKEIKRKKTPRQKIWSSVRVMRQFTLEDIQTVSECSYSSVTKFISLLIKAGYAKVIATRGKLGGRQYTYQLIKNSGPLPPKQAGKNLFDPNTNQVCTIST